MNGSLSLDLHFWRGIGPDKEPDLFVWRYRLGFLTVGIARVNLLDRIHQLRAAIERAITKSEGR